MITVHVPPKIGERTLIFLKLVRLQFDKYKLVDTMTNSTLMYMDKANMDELVRQYFEIQDKEIK